MKTHSPDLPALLEHALGLAVHAGGRILEIYESDFAVSHKGDDSPLTQADLAQNVLAPLIAAAFPFSSSGSNSR